ncbi:MAG: LTA synthase family protein [Coriobacteriales bacterium]|nr:LTA synthase family protein [Coriobacteriales bacterium]
MEPPVSEEPTLPNRLPTGDQVRALLALALVVALVLAKIVFVRRQLLGGGALASDFALEAPFALVVLLLVDAFFADMRFRALLVADAVVSVALLGVAVYASFYGQLPTAESLLGAGQAATVGDSVLALLRPWHGALVADVVVLGMGAFVVERVRRARGRARTIAPPFQHAAVYATLVPLLAVLIVGIVTVRHLPQPVDGMAAARSRGMTTFLAASSTVRPAPEVGAVDLWDPIAMQEGIEDLRRGSVRKRLADFAPGAAQGKNVIIIQVEALQTAAVGARMGGSSVTPNLDRLIGRSWYFPNGVSQVGRGTTSDAEFSVNSSLYPSLRAASSLAYGSRTIPSLPRLLHAEGYATATFHTNDVSYWNRGELYAALGFDRYYDRRFFKDEDRIAFGSSDEVLFRGVLGELSKHQRNAKPFYAHVVTMSSHHPFTAIPAGSVPVRPSGEFEGTFTGDYLSAISYADLQIGEFVEDLEESGLLDESILIIYGDHFGIPGDDPADDRDAVARRALFGGTQNRVDTMSVPFIVHMPGQTAGRRSSEPFGQTDVAPTVAGALGVDTTAMPHFGRDVFAGQPVLMPGGGFMPPGTYVDERILFVPGSGFDDGAAAYLGTGSPAPRNLATAGKWERIRRMLNLSDAYARSLPVRPGHDLHADAVMPAAAAP